MPQLDTVYVFYIYLWTWLILYLIMQKIKTVMFATNPKKQPQTAPNKPTHTPTLPWT
uniref:ATP synthase F0 subunit 8 n=1 Tax=Sibon nebulatus TaxID=211651 RepID=C5H4Z5_SIBNE|nr:ATP synthase F0 subunit 8 [Sibon nebulatus]ACD77372.1 ATP synthase F0 subunit 8 [Sibon nebulatus]